MRYLYTLILLSLASPLHAQSDRCILIEKRLDAINSQLELAKEQYKINFKAKALPLLKERKQLKLNADSKFVKSLSKLVVASVTYEALAEVCREQEKVSKPNTP